MKPLVLFGATGFTGIKVAQHISLTYPNLNWAIAGRSESSLLRVQQLLQNKFPDASVPKLIIADCSDAQSMDQMASSASIVLNCVGPYRFFGEAVVRACVEHKCHYVDVTGEPEFMEKMVLKFDDLAREHKVVIVSACGFDCVPADLGFVEILKKFDQEKVLATKIKSYLEIESGDDGISGHYATYESAIHALSSVDQLKSIRKQLKQKNKIELVHPGKESRMNSWPEYDRKVSRWVIPFPGSDASVVRRTSLHMFKNGRTNIPRYEAMYSISSTLWMIVGVFMAFIVKLLSSFKVGTKILLKNPKFFSCGVFSHDGPSEKQLKETKFKMKFFAEGYSNPEAFAQLAANNAEFYEFPSPDIRIQAEFRGPEPGYVATPILVLESAMVILEEFDRISSFGVLTPGAAFQNTSMVDRLRKHGVSFEIKNSNLTKN
jgi:short subunit dehydrogenase-like uncharacterized protein